MQVMRVLVSMFALLTGPFVHAQEAFDFWISKGYMEMLANEGAAQVSLKMFNGRTKSVHSLAKDCEMNLAADPVGILLGEPNSIVAEPPNP